MTNNQRIAQTILEQLGGSQFVVMTGSNNFVATDRGLYFRFPQSEAGRPNACAIKLTPADEYDMTFSYVRSKYAPRITHTHKGVFFDQLQDLFEQATGLYVRL